jgi:hypothetical protein
VDPASFQLDEEQHLQPPQPDGVDGEEITGHDPRGLLAEERLPGCRCRKGSWGFMASGSSTSPGRASRR